LLDDITESVRNAALELCSKAGLKAGQTVIVGCSTSEITGHNIGTNSSSEIGYAVLGALHSVFSSSGIFIAAQCCQHLNRAVVVEREAAAGCQIVYAVPTPGAGGAFAAAAYTMFTDPVVVEMFSADAGLDIGNTLIGMHLKRVAIPLRLEIKNIGEAAVVAASTRPPFIGGDRTKYE